MIPKNIAKEHVIRAIGEIQRVGFPKNRVSRKYLVKYCDRDYPPKYVISLANTYINDRLLEPSEFGGGSETNGFLERLGFEIVGTAAPEKSSPSSVKKDARTKSSRSKRNEGCPL